MSSIKFLTLKGTQLQLSDICETKFTVDNNLLKSGVNTVGVISEYNKRKVINKHGSDSFYKCGFSYELVLDNVEHAMPIYFKPELTYDDWEGFVYYVIPPLRMMINENIHIPNITPPQNIVAIVLAAGHSTRFSGSTVKQLAIIDGKQVLLHTVDIVRKVVSEVIVVTNKQLYEDVCKLCPQCIVVIADGEHRLTSIKRGFEVASTLSPSHILIHDAARPFVPLEYYQELLHNAHSFHYVQYVMKLINGLHCLDRQEYPETDRERYVELVTPLCINHKLAEILYNKYIFTGVVSELHSILDIYGVKYKLIHGNPSYLHKVTYASGGTPGSVDGSLKPTRLAPMPKPAP
jgi:2-C-methyl-D-erythritol 4-phosphate cytidylyltransferase